MNLHAKITDEVWGAVESAYERRDYAAAIIDAVHFLGDLIRDRAGLDSDGTDLVGKAFGGASPKLKVNKLETESERNVQKGMEFLLRGIYHAIRNPRSHEKHLDSEEDADAIIAFIDYLVRNINRSKAPYTRSDLLKKVFDEDFVESDRYANLLVEEIPEKKRLDAFIAVFRKKETGKSEKLKFFFHELLGGMTEEEKQAALDVVQKELRSTSDETAIRQIIQITPPDCWEHFDEAVRLRIENKLIKSASQGVYDNRSSECTSGALGTWISRLSEGMLMKDKLADTFVEKLSGSDGEKDYAFKFLFPCVRTVFAKPDIFITLAITRGLKKGDKRFRDALEHVMTWGPEEWQEPFKQAYDEFKEAPTVADIGITDDDVPF